MGLARSLNYTTGNEEPLMNLVQGMTRSDLYFRKLLLIQGQMERLRNELRSSLSLLTGILSDFHLFIYIYYLYLCSI